MKNKCLFFLLLFFLISCNKEVSELPYIGSWETDIIAVPAEDSMALLNRNMVCTFEEENFTGAVNRVIGHINEPICEFIGNLKAQNTNVILFEITNVGNRFGTDVEWYDTSAAEFDTINGLYLSAFIPVRFEAQYYRADDELNLIFNNDTLRLYKK